ncbi:MAG: P-II family nitrogen regulator, partial [Desulfovibrionaceae bacterium]|nr:P-II family nitrogen regulator [Desulfovibrionaceae bacterium]
DRLVDITKEAGARGGTVLLGRGTAKSDLLQMLGFGDSRKELVLTLAAKETAEAITAALTKSEWVAKKVRGVLFSVDVQALHKASVLSLVNRDMSMSTNTAPSHELITVIVNAGYAEDVMAAARKAGATGGTILHGRGTAREEDSKFFGLSIVPEKDILIILAASSASRQILEAVRTTKCLKEPGMGIAFCTAVETFVPLGRQG